MAEKTYTLENCKIKVCLEPGLIRVYSDAGLWRFLDGKAPERFQLLAETIKKDYQSQYDRPLHISDDSLIVEILVHVYCDYLGLSFNRIIRMNWIRALVKKLLKRAEIVDCGEKAKDSNRWLWDLLSHGKPALIRLLPKNLNAKKLKPS